MRTTLLILLAFALLTQIGCRRQLGNEAAEANETVQTADLQDGSHARTLLAQGKQFYQNDQDEKAIEAFKQALKLDPDLAEAHFRLGLTYGALGDEQQAEESYKKAVASYRKYFSVEGNEKDAEAHYNLAQTLAGLHLYTEAVREYRQAVKLKEDDADIYYDMGLALSRLAQYDQAVDAFEKSLAIDPENYRAEDELAEAREGVKRIRAGRKHQEDLLKKKRAEEEKKQQEEGQPTDGTHKPKTAPRPSGTKSAHKRRTVERREQAWQPTHHHRISRKARYHHLTQSVTGSSS